MNDKLAVIEKIHQAFGGNDYPGDGFLQGSTEGCEPYEEVGPFVGRRHWQEIEPDFLDPRPKPCYFFRKPASGFPGRPISLRICVATYWWQTPYSRLRVGFLT